MEGFDEYMTNKNKNKKKQGRPSKLTSELQAEIILLLKTGNFVETACHVVGINKSTFYDWIKKGEKTNHPHNKYKIFQGAVEHAMAWSEARDVALIAKHAENDFNASKWRLSRRFPDKWGKKKYDDYDLDIGDVEEDLVDISKEDYVIIKEALRILATQPKEQ